MRDELLETFKKFEEYLKSEIHTVALAKVTKVNEKTINCRLVINKKTKQNEEIQVAEMQFVPVLNLSGGNNSIQMPIKIGDYAILLINERCFDSWYLGQDFTLPVDRRSFDYSDAIAIVGIKNQANELNIPTDNITITGNTDLVGDLNITGDLNVSGRITCKELVIDGNNYSQHVHGGVTTGSGQTSTPE